MRRGLSCAGCRLALDRADTQSDSELSLELVLEHVAGAAFVVTAQGRVLFANTSAKAALSHEGDAVAPRILDAIRGERRFFVVHSTICGGQARRFLVIATSDEDPTQGKLARAAKRWRLTDRQREVLGWVVQGCSNARISAELGIVERTVECHITAILERAGSVSRAELISAVLTAGGLG